MGVDDLVPLLEITDKLDVLLEIDPSRFVFF
jgi:hypothetical protein